MFYIVETDIPVYFLIGFGVFGVFQEEKLAKRYINNNKIRWYMRFFLNMNDDGMYRIDYFKPKCKNGLKMDSPTRRRWYAGCQGGANSPSSDLSILDIY